MQYAQDPFCVATASYYSRCNHCSDCTGQNIEYCAGRGAASSAAYRAALPACKDSAPCNVDPAFSRCVEEQMQGATPTPAQAAAKTAYCASCMTTNPDDCNSFFMSDPTTGKTGVGYNVLLASDDLAMMATANCSTMCTPLNYALCVAFQSCKQSGGDHCQDGGFCAPQ